MDLQYQHQLCDSLKGNMMAGLCLHENACLIKRRGGGAEGCQLSAEAMYTLTIINLKVRFIPRSEFRKVYVKIVQVL